MAKYTSLCMGYARKTWFMPDMDRFDQVCYAWPAYRLLLQICLIFLHHNSPDKSIHIWHSPCFLCYSFYGKSMNKRKLFTVWWYSRNGTLIQSKKPCSHLPTEVWSVTWSVVICADFPAKDWEIRVYSQLILGKQHSYSTRVSSYKFET